MNLFSKVWNDDAGVVTIEYLVLGTFLALALIVGVATLARAINSELVELGNAILTFNQSYNVDSYSTCVAIKTGSGATDTCDIVQPASETGPTCNIDVLACN